MNLLLLTGLALAAGPEWSLTRPMEPTAVVWRGDTIAVAQRDGTVLILNGSGQELRRLSAGRRSIDAVGLSADGQRLVAVEAWGDVTVWDVTTGERLDRHKGGWFQGGQQATLTDDGRALLWLDASGQLVVDPVGDGEPTLLSANLYTGPGQLGVRGGQAWAFSGEHILRWGLGDGAYVEPLHVGVYAQTVVSLADSFVLLNSLGAGWSVDPTTGERARVELSGFQGWLVAAHPTERQLAYVTRGPGNKQAVIVWDLVTERPLAAMGVSVGYVNGLTWSPDGDRLLIAGPTGVAVVNAPNDDAPQAKPHPHLHVQLVGFDADARHALAVFADGELLLWELGTGQLDGRRTLSMGQGYGDQPVVALRHDGAVIAALTPSGAAELWRLDAAAPTAAVVGLDQAGISFTREGLLTVRDPRGVSVWPNDGAAPRRSHVEPGITAVSPNGERVARFSWDGALTVLEGDRVLLSRGSAGAPSVVWAAFYDEDTLLTLDVEGRLRRQSISGREALEADPLQLPDGPFTAVMDHWGHRLLIAHSDGSLSLIDLDTMSLLGRAREGNGLLMSTPVDALALHPDGQRALIAGDHGEVQLWDMVTGKLLRTYTGTRPGGLAITALPAQEAVLVSWRGGALRVFGAADGAERLAQTHPEEITALAALDGGASAVSGSVSGVVSVLDAQLNPLWRSEPAGQPIVQLAVSPDSTKLAARLADGTILRFTRAPDGGFAPNPSEGLWGEGVSFDAAGALVIVGGGEAALGEAILPSPGRRHHLAGPVARCDDGGLILALTAWEDNKPSLWSPDARPSGVGLGEASALHCASGLLIHQGWSGQLTALDRTTGATTLRTQLDGEPLAGVAVASPTQVIALSTSGLLRAWDPQQNAVRWSVTLTDEPGEQLPVEVMPVEPVTEEPLGE
ncbi:MAG: WD40 repeat domain-containing protein [Deltaproteobacteria bacterium]|nr:WD40 repeat domain-containing protein [Deltaproteobacteria bacterium]